MKLLYGLLSCAATLGSLAVSADAQVITENFDNITLLAGSGWSLQNNSTSAANAWFQGNATVFTAQSGATNSYIGSNYQLTSSTASTGATISNWLIAPAQTYQPGNTISFFTRIPSGTEFPDRLEVRFSAGTGSDVGTTPTSVGTFTTLVGSINPTLTTGVYPKDWTQFTYNIPLNAPTEGRVAFRYFVTDGGVNGDNSNYIGLDTVRLNAVPAPGSAMIALVGFAPLAGFALRRRARG